MRAAGFQDLFYLQDPELSFEQVSPLQPGKLCLVEKTTSPLRRDAAPSLEGWIQGQDSASKCWDHEMVQLPTAPMVRDAKADLWS